MKVSRILSVGAVALLCLGFSCNQPVQSVSGTKMAVAGDIKTGPDGLTVEQKNIKDRIQADNQPGSIKHLYVVSAYSGQVIIYSTVRGKVTSSGKRLTPASVEDPNSVGFVFNIGGEAHYTRQVLGEDGTYGSSSEYLYWWDTRGVYHQHYVSGGQIVHVSNQPLAVKGIIINMELTAKPEQ